MESSERVQFEFSGGDRLQTLPDRTFHPRPSGRSRQHILLSQPIQQQRVTDESKSKGIAVPKNRADQIQHAGSTTQIFQHR